MPGGIEHSKCSKRILGRNYSYIHAHMDAPSKGILRWHHRLVRHNPFVHPIYYTLKHRNPFAGLACLQHIIQDYIVQFLIIVIIGILLWNAGKVELIKSGVILIGMALTVITITIEVPWMIPGLVFRAMFKRK